MTDGTPTRPDEGDMIQRPRLYARAASLASLAAENETLREALAAAKERIAELEQGAK